MNIRASYKSKLVTFIREETGISSPPNKKVPRIPNKTHLDSTSVHARILAAYLSTWNSKYYCKGYTFHNHVCQESKTGAEGWYAGV